MNASDIHLILIPPYKKENDFLHVIYLSQWWVEKMLKVQFPMTTAAVWMCGSESSWCVMPSMLPLFPVEDPKTGLSPSAQRIQIPHPHEHILSLCLTNSTNIKNSLS